MIYNIYIKARVESDLSKEQLEGKLVVALYDVDSGYSKLDGTDDNLEVEDYERTDVEEICPHCEIELSSKMIDVDGTNIVECDVCEECGYGTPAML